MRAVFIYPALCLGLSVAAVGCARDRADSPSDTSTPVAGTRGAGDAKQVEVTGCLTANNETNEFVLTADDTALTSMTNRAAAGESETFHYQLVGGQDLQSHVGRQVRVTGTLQTRGEDVDLERGAPTETREPSRGEEPAPSVETSEEVAMQVARLRVASITPTGEPCQIGQGIQPRPPS